MITAFLEVRYARSGKKLAINIAKVIQVSDNQ
jgi:hypothetical protein